MIGDETRRKVARNLRCLACTPEEIGITEHAVIRNLGISAGIYDDSCRSEDVLIVADLIDRPTCETIEHGRPDESHVCKSCSRCSYGWFEDIHDKPYSYCPNCGAEVLDR